MAGFKKTILSKATRVLDVLTLFIAWLLTIPEQPLLLSVDSFLNQSIYSIHWSFLVSWVFTFWVWHRIFKYFSLYQKRRFDNQWREWFDIISAVTLCVGFWTLFEATFGVYHFSLDKILLFWFLATTMTMFSRSLVRVLLKFLRQKGRNLADFIVVGSNSRAVGLASRLLARKELGYRFLGYVDTPQYFVRNGLPRDEQLCTLDQFTRFVENQPVDQIFIMLPIKSYYKEIQKIIELCQELGVPCRVPSDWFGINAVETVPYEIDGVPILSLQTQAPHLESALLVKRVADILLASLGLILFAPLLILIAAAIRIDSKGPVIYVQKRVGLNRRRFNMFKFRTMVADSDLIQSSLEHLNEADGPTFKIKDDPRITRIGHILRRSSLDELPQLLNVFRGEMSIVGPRPLPIRDFNGFQERWQKRRFVMKPGLTCLWQIKGRNALSFIEWMKLDLEYIDNWSLQLDLRIILKTVPVIFKATGR